MEPRRPAPPKSGRSAELPGSLSGALRSVPPRAREPHAPPPPGHASPLPPRSPPAAVKLGRPRLAPGPRAHTKLLRPQLPGARGKGGRGGERGRGAAGASARPEARDAAPPPPPRSPPGPAREHRAEARPAQSPALAGNSAARLPRSRLAGPPTSIRSRARPLRLPSPLQGRRGLPAPQGMPNPGEREVGQEEEEGAARGGAEALRRQRSGSSRVLGGPARLTATTPRRALMGAAAARAPPPGKPNRAGQKNYKGRRFKGRDHIP